MKKLSYLFLLMFSMSIVFTGCREETSKDNVEDAVEDVADDIEDAVD